MKYGVLLNTKTDNIGDDIQSYAACRFLPSVDYIIDRESLDTFCFGKDQEPVSVIMNGWFMYNKFNWPPAPSINPLLLSMHFSGRDYYGVGEKYLESIGGEYLNYYGPVGARDHATKEILERKGIATYYSGCLTLTLKRQDVESGTGRVILVDLDEADKTAIKETYPAIEFEELTHYVNPNEYKNVPGKERLNQVEMLLGKYQRAKCVITSRMHCALPCLALGTPVLLVYKQENLNRFQDFFPFLHVAASGTLGGMKDTFDIENPPKNSVEFLMIREELERRCADFIQKAESGSILPPYNVTLEELHLWQKSLVDEADLSIRNTVWELTQWIQELEKGKEWNVEQLELAQARLKKFDRLKGLLGMGEKGVITKVRKHMKD